MKRGREEKNSHETLPSPRRLRHGGVINIPLDVTVEILKKLPTKSLLRFQCVSKLWSSIISSRRDLIDSIVTRSLNEPPRDAHIISLVSSNCFPNRICKSFIAFSSTTCPGNTDKELVLVPGQYHQSVRGLVCCWSHFPNVVAIYNPTTRQSFDLPELKYNHMYMCDFFFGYDPIKNQYKVIFLPRGTWDGSCQVFTLGDPTAKQWRNIQHDIRPHQTLLGVVCINGTIYYREGTRNPPFLVDIKLMSFDVRLEKFDHVEAPKVLMHLHRDSTLINYQEKLGLISCERVVEIWVMETQGWSKFFLCEKEDFHSWSIAGTTRGGEIVLVKSLYWSYDKLRVYYYDLKGNSMRYVELENCYTEDGNRKGYASTIWTGPDHVENIMGLH
ncbi:unnamed protein product [Arabidopsis lyrata]|uniref:F-box domain-containing protein n=1 Tax=Arabidopsis lyrata subsp. lyrata TaxID=81972 RepID=D7LPG8_ARALL|nr:probable F-box protein At3g56670 [Arabidopsis lyrata subsp. lyrata]EFH53311.1 hypothetical protein ARALYDRAFT_904986 [Arabidopsis lyrata subsp. lyrata]CAH8266942.1 unnamed protein product [Arabidopsis lyrata]|eukprot:XP_002877052.1 probable F-box protein At3g56670 [Arabidopsis lyrata subsp. lyrata]